MDRMIKQIIAGAIIYAISTELKAWVKAPMVSKVVGSSVYVDEPIIIEHVIYPGRKSYDYFRVK